ncbi:MAG: tetratricopeptide repeat protein [Chitinophagaceae bacterium]
MKIIFCLVAGLFIMSAGYAQDEIKQFIDKGIALHDKGDYDGAIAQYNEALKLDPVNAQALYEKSFSLLSLKKYDEVIIILKQLLKDSKSEEYRKLAYINYGTTLDNMDEKKKAIEVYEQGIREFPKSYLLHFNKGITETGMNLPEEALKSFGEAVMLNGLHASSHNALARLQYDKNRIPAVLAFFTFLVIEPTSKRSEQNLELMNKLLYKGISKGENGNVTIAIDADMLGKKKKNKEDDFSTSEFMLSLLGADNTVADSMGAKTEADRLDYKMQMLINVINEQKKKEKGFFKNFYVPMFAEMKEKNFVKTACYIALRSMNNTDMNGWLKEHEQAVDEFNSWLKGYWTKWD